MFEVGGGGVGGVLQACQPSVIRTETPSFWRLKSLSLEGQLEKKIQSIFGNQVCNGFLVLFRQFVSPLVMRHNDVG